ncbi:MAG: YgiQ family radical SAM protein [Candidatus Sedimenticola endophacoides]|uniref:YgiQ family radical SAM protein n=1 Tax=Candidatus Sedimenticola endophacoides TaxID=2548426 RepID=A0A6N4DU34_9GAMM|nr:MAG: YgiQ family radical SAM protein [Candidatus Sedimenticola endophacoides]OQX41350.1 MAG: YgiQ family radical SAM protein [Candidatus Sedimenticola endophacoides]PUE01513.1 MAG: YgiQ family radical SAM protein [Candidatus Sedimenticola endophacoides]PUE03420.1 MAG: YgiQ family radical SAM protein [Candidatus Sedimenticola endophacoides]PUE04760.1 MAG: YgiQ family radical SAM protein [Candidatus Sedimenticola endophacoides]
MQTAPDLFSYRPYWAKRFGVARELPISRAEMDTLGWDSCDIILVTGDAYVDHPSFGMALIGRLLEAQGFRVGIIAQPDWTSPEDFRRLGRPNLFFGVTAGNMDSMVNRYTAERRIRSNDAYTPGGEGGRRPDRSVIVYAQRAREAFKGVAVIVGGIEASLRRIAHYDYWSDKVRRSILPDSKADMLIYGNAERAVVEVAHRLARGEAIGDITDVRGTGFMRRGVPPGWLELDSSVLDEPGPLGPRPDPYAGESGCAPEGITITPPGGRRPRGTERSRSVVRLPSHDQVAADPVLYAHASRVFHLETNPGNARALIQRHGRRDVWLNPPPLPLTTPELDRLYEFPYTRNPHSSYGTARNPAWEMIRFSIPIMRGCFGGCTFCSITEHEGRIIQSRSEASVIREIEALRDQAEGFTGTISDLGGPTANMYRMRCASERIEASCRRLSCVYPEVCRHMGTSHKALIGLYRRARAVAGVKRVLIASGLRYDLAVRDPEYVRELVAHHVGGYLKIAPEHTEAGPLAMMMKPGIATYDRFKRLFDKYSREAGKEQYLIPYFIAAHPGTSDRDMLNLALWLKENGFRPDQVQAFLPTPLAVASAMYHTGLNPLRRISRRGGRVEVPRGERQRRLHKAFLRYHDAENWPLLREALTAMGRSDLIGNGKRHLVPAWQPRGTGASPTAVHPRGAARRDGAGPRPGRRVRKGRRGGRG